MNIFRSLSVPLLFVFILFGCDSQKSADEYIKNGLAYAQSNEWSTAIIEYKNAVKQEPDNMQARFLLGQAYLKTLRADDAIKELSRAKELDAGKGDVYLQLGKAYELKGDHQNIIDEIQPSSSQDDVTRAGIYALRAIAYLNLSEPVAAADALDKAKALDGEGTDVRLAWATYESLRGNVEAQVRWLQPLLERDGGVAGAWSQMGEIEQGRNDLTEAEAAYSRSVELRNAVHFDYVRRALVRISLGNLEGAEKDVNTVRNAGATWPIISHVEGVLEYQRKNFPDAQAHFLTVLSRSPGYGPSEMMLGLSYFMQGSLENAKSYLQLYLAKNPSDFRANLVLATINLKTGNEKSALSILTRLDTENPGNFRVLSLLSDAYFRSGLKESGFRTLRKAVNAKPDEVGTRLQLGNRLIRDPVTAELGQKELIKVLEINPGLQQAQLLLYASYLKNKEFDRAMEIAVQIKDEQDGALGGNLQAQIFLAQDDNEKAISELERVLSEFPEDNMTSENLARIHLRNKNFSAARQLLLKVLERSPEHLPSINQMAYISSLENNDEEMLKWLETGVERNPEATQPKLQLANQYLLQKMPEKAISLLNGVKEDQKSLPGYQLLMARGKLVLNETDHALRLLKNVIAANPGNALAHFLMAQVHARNERLDNMRESLQRTIELSSDFLTPHLILARLDYANGDQEEFEKRLLFLEENFPLSKEVALLKASRDTLEKNYDAAIETLATYLDQDPSVEVALGLSENQWRAGNRDEAIDNLELWIQNNGEEQKALFMLANFYTYEGRYSDAVKIYEKLDSKVPDNAVVLNNLAWALRDSNPEKGAEYAERAFKLEPENPFVMDTLAILLLKSGDKQRALEYSEKAAAKATGSFDIQFNYAEVLIQNNQKEKARSKLEELLQKLTNEDLKSRVNDKLQGL